MGWLFHGVFMYKSVCTIILQFFHISFFLNDPGASAIAPSAAITPLDIYIYIHTHTHTVGYAITNKCYNEQFLSIISGCYNEHRCYKESGGILSADITRACA